MADYAMRARSADNAAYLYWVSLGDADPTGVNAPAAILPGSAVITTLWGAPSILFDAIINEYTSSESTAVPFTVANPGEGKMNLVLVDTANVSWTNGASITLPLAPALRSRITIKDGTGAAGTKSINVAGNGRTIDGDAAMSINRAFHSYTLLNAGAEWVII